MGRSLLGLAILVATSVAAVAQPAGNFRVIRPKPPAVEAQPDKPGFITVRPRGPDGKSQLVANRGQLPAAPAGDPPPVPAVAAKEKPPEEVGKVVHEAWYAMFLKGMKAGSYHVVVREYERDGKTFRYATKTQKLAVARFGQPAIRTNDPDEAWQFTTFLV